MNSDIWENYVNPAFWVLTNLCVIAASIVIVLYWLVYTVFFRFMQFEGGRLIWQLVTFIVGLVFLAFVGIWVNPIQPWYIPPPEVLWWRPGVRFAIYMLGTATVVQMLISIIRRLLTRQSLLIEVKGRRKEDAPVPKDEGIETS